MNEEEIKTFIEFIQNKDPSEEAPWEYGEWYDGWSDAIKWVASELEKHLG